MWCNISPLPLFLSSRLLSSCRFCSWPQNRLPCCPRSSGRASSSSKSRFRRRQERRDSPAEPNWFGVGPVQSTVKSRSYLWFWYFGILTRDSSLQDSTSSLSAPSDLKASHSFRSINHYCVLCHGLLLSGYYVLSIKQIEMGKKLHLLNSVTDSFTQRNQ